MFARTERLLLRPGWPEDAPALTESLGDAAVVRNLARVPWPYGRAEAEDWLGRPQDPRQPTLLIFARTDGGPALVGGIGLADKAEPAPGVAELGYWIAQAHWRRGYATEAARAVLDMGFRTLRLRRIEAGHFADNAGSARVLAKLGFIRRGWRMLGRAGLRPAAEYCPWYRLDATSWLAADHRLVA
jgi:RimJ/RimL family protein N-acetyltransferase